MTRTLKSMFVLAFIVALFSCQNGSITNDQVTLKLDGIATPSIQPSEQMSEERLNNPSAISSGAPVQVTSQPSIASTFSPASATAIPTLPSISLVETTTRYWYNDLKGPLVSYLRNDIPSRNLIHIIDLGSQLSYEIESYHGIPLRIKWVESGCALISTIRTSDGVELVKIDLLDMQQEIIYRYLRDQPSLNSKVFHGNWEVSPSGSYVAYLVYAGEHYYSTSQFQDVEVVSLYNTSERHRLTKNGGSLGASWTPDGNLIVFSDFDESGIRQIFRSSPDGTDVMKLTNFDDPGSQVGEPVGNFIGNPYWAPDGQKFVVESGVTDYEGFFSNSLWSVSLDGIQQLQLTNGTIDEIHVMGWSEDSRTVAMYARQVTESEGDATSLMWIDVSTGDMVRILEGGRLPESNIQLVAAVRGINKWVGLDPQGLAFLLDFESETSNPLSNIAWPQNTLFDLSGSLPGEMVRTDQIIAWDIHQEVLQGNNGCMP